MESDNRVDVSRIDTIDCIFKFDEEMENPNFFIKDVSCQSLHHIDHKSLMRPKNLFFTLKRHT